VATLLRLFPTQVLAALVSFPIKINVFLTLHGFLADGDSFKLKKQHRSLASLDPDEQQRVEEFAKRTKKLRGTNLIRNVYVNYPYYAIRSEIKETILNEKELREVERAKNPDNTVVPYDNRL